MQRFLIALLAMVCLAIHADSAETAASVTQYGITWTFDKDYPVGQFVNGDWWVVGPAKIIAITNTLNDKAFLPTDGTAVNGSMINPAVNRSATARRFQGGRSCDHGYDSRLSDYRAEINAALPGGKPLAADNPIELKPDQSLVSVVSWLWRSNEDKEEGCPRVPPPGTLVSISHVRPTIRTAAVLTCLDKVPTEDSFRPAYCGDEKRMFRLGQIRLDRLAKLDPVPEISNNPVPREYPALDYPAIIRGMSIPQMTYATSRFWLSYIPNYFGDEAFHPSLNMPNYGREICWILSTSMLALNADWDKIEGKPDKMPLLTNLIQIGIDYAGAADAGSIWVASGGHHGGRKPAILFAGILLDDEHMMNVGHWETRFQDNEQFIHVNEDHVAANDAAKRAIPAFNSVIQGAYHIPATAEVIGLPEWIFWGVLNGDRGANVAWNNTAYRFINNSYIPTFALVFTIMENGRKLYNHEPYFDYADRIMSRDQEFMKGHNYESLSAFSMAMWRKYRDSYPSTYDVKWDDKKFIDSIMKPMIIPQITPEGRQGYDPSAPIRINWNQVVADLSKITPEHVKVTDPAGNVIAVEKITPGEPQTDHVLLHFATDTLKSGDYMLKFDEEAIASLRDELGRPPLRDLVVFRVK